MHPIWKILHAMNPLQTASELYHTKKQHQAEMARIDLERQELEGRHQLNLRMVSEQSSLLHQKLQQETDERQQLLEQHFALQQQQLRGFLGLLEEHRVTRDQLQEFRMAHHQKALSDGLSLEEREFHQRSAVALGQELQQMAAHETTTMRALYESTPQLQLPAASSFDGLRALLPDPNEDDDF